MHLFRLSFFFTSFCHITYWLLVNYIYNIYTDRENIKVNCDSIDWCIDSVYEQKDDYFNKSRLTSGFKVDSISLLAYKEDIIPFINDNNLECEIK